MDQTTAAAAPLRQPSIRIARAPAPKNWKPPRRPTRPLHKRVAPAPDHPLAVLRPDDDGEAVDGLSMQVLRLIASHPLGEEDFALPDAKRPRLDSSESEPPEPLPYLPLELWAWIWAQGAASMDGCRAVRYLRAVTRVCREWRDEVAADPYRHLFDALAPYFRGRPSLRLSSAMQRVRPGSLWERLLQEATFRVTYQQLGSRRYYGSLKLVRKVAFVILNHDITSGSITGQAPARAGLDCLGDLESIDFVGPHAERHNLGWTLADWALAALPAMPALRTMALSVAQLSGLPRTLVLPQVTVVTVAPPDCYQPDPELAAALVVLPSLFPNCENLSIPATRYRPLDLAPMPCVRRLHVATDFFRFWDVRRSFPALESLTFQSLSDFTAVCGAEQLRIDDLEVGWCKAGHSGPKAPRVPTATPPPLPNPGDACLPDATAAVVGDLLTPGQLQGMAGCRRLRKVTFLATMLQEDGAWPGIMQSQLHIAASPYYDRRDRLALLEDSRVHRSKRHRYYRDGRGQVWAKLGGCHPGALDALRHLEEVVLVDCDICHFAIFRNFSRLRRVTIRQSGWLPDRILEGLRARGVQVDAQTTPGQAQ